MGKQQSKERVTEESCTFSHDSKDGLQDAGVRSSDRDDQQREGASLEIPAGAPCRPEGTGPATALEPLESGGCPSNTHPLSSQFELNGFPEYLVAGGLDWFEWTAHVCWERERFATIVQLLESTKRILQEGTDSHAFVTLDGISDIRVRRIGRNRGRERGQHYDFNLSYDGVPIALAARQIALDTLPNVWIQQTGSHCLLVGAEEGYHKAREFILSLGGVITKETLSRVDLTIDIAGLDVRMLQDLAEAGQFVSRASKVHPHTDLAAGQKTGLSAGHAPLHMTIYDKLEAHMGKCDRLYVQGLIDRRWGGRIPKAATRIEFQVWRSWLRENGISSPSDFMLNSGAVAHKLTHNWFRLTDRPVDRANKNHSRAGTHPLWRAIQEAYATVYCEPTGELVPIDRASVDPVQLIKQARGCLKAALLQKGQSPKNYEEFSAHSSGLILDVGGTDDEREQFMRNFHSLATEYRTSPKGRAA